MTYFLLKVSKNGDKFICNGVNAISVTRRLLLPSPVLNMGHGALISPRGHAVTCSITCPLLGKLPDVCDHAVGRANPVMTQTVN